jgi:hypothetical protein
MVYILLFPVSSKLKKSTMKYYLLSMCTTLDNVV